MKIFFINPPFKAEYGKFSRESRSPSIGHSGVLYYPLWLIYAAALAEKNGFEIEFLDAPANLFNEEKSLDFIKLHVEGTKLFVFDTSTPSIYSDVQFAERIKALYPKTFVLLVGTHPSAVPEETLAISTSIDAVARREYDYTVLELAKALKDDKPLETVKGITFRKSDTFVANPDMEYIEDLDEIPFAAKFIKEHLNYKDYFFPAATYPEIQMFTGRGCPAMCNFCVYPQTMHGHKYRLRSAQNVIAEFEYIAENFPDVKEIVIEDDTFTINKARVAEICNLLIEHGLNRRFKWLCNARVNLDCDTMKLMKKAGCRLIIPGIESTCQTILNNIKKGTKVEEIKRYIASAKEAKLNIHACYMVGNNGETQETMQQTLKDALKFKTDTAQFFPLIPYPGTEAYKWAKDNGYISGKYEEYCNEDGTLNSVLNLPSLSSEQMVDFCARARKKYYLRPWYIAHRIWKGLCDFEDLKRSLKGFATLSKTLFKKR